MKVRVIGGDAAEVGREIGGIRGHEVVEDGADAVVISPQARGALASARRALRAGQRVLLTSVPTRSHDEWSRLAGRHRDRLALSRSMRFDRLLAAAKDSVRAGNVGQARTIHLGWSFPGRPRSSRQRQLTGLIDGTALLADAALWLLEAAPERIYALRCEVDGAPLMMANIQASSGFLASIETTLGTDGYPPLRELSLLGADGAIYHRTAQDDILFTKDGAEVLGHTEDSLVREASAWLDDAAPTRQNLAGGDALRLAIALTRAIADSIERGEPVAVESTAGGRSNGKAR